MVSGHVPECCGDVVGFFVEDVLVVQLLNRTATMTMPRIFTMTNCSLTMLRRSQALTIDHF
jgi:hypothetical protein